MNVNAVAGLWDAYAHLARRTQAESGIPVTPTNLVNAILVAHFPDSPAAAAAVVQSLLRRQAAARDDAAA